MKIKNAFTILFLSWLVAAVAILGVAFVICPDAYVDGFWARVAWTEFLNLLFWIGGAGWFTENKTNTAMGITPAVSFLTSIYCVLSFIVMVGFYQIEPDGDVNDAHLVIQIVLFAVYALMILRLYLAAHFAEKDLVIQADAGISAADLAQNIRSVEASYPQNVGRELKKLREKISYSLQDNNRLRTNAAYKRFSENVLRKIDAGDISVADIQNFIAQVDNLRHQTKRV